MPSFDYTAKTRDGAKKTGQVDAADRRGALIAVEALGFIPLVVTQSTAASKKALAHKTKAAAGKVGKYDKGGKVAAAPKRKSSAFKLARPNHMSRREVLLFTGELCDLIEGGMTLGNALNCLCGRGDADDGPTQVISALRDGIIEGATFSAALGKFPKVFGTIYMNMIRAGEASGDMTGVLRRLIVHYERQQEVRAKVTGAMVYPCIVLVMAIGVVIFAVTWLIPQFKPIFDQIGPDALPASTKMLLGMSDWCKRYFVFLLIASVAGVVALRKWVKPPAGARRWDALKL
ncbi:MAG: type II secretion system F family protein, partial [Kiritimatiellaeota bacterium]|nr:type II secretion system F family protein [Kiritimatiellota bacterium]